MGMGPMGGMMGKGAGKSRPDRASSCRFEASCEFLRMAQAGPTCLGHAGKHCPNPSRDHLAETAQASANKSGRCRALRVNLGRCHPRPEVARAQFQTRDSPAV